MPEPVKFELKVIRFDSRQPVTWVREQNLSFLPPKEAVIDLSFDSVHTTSVLGYRFEMISVLTMRVVVELRGFMTFDNSLDRPKWDRDPRLYATWNTEHLGDLEKLLRKAYWESL